MNLDFLYEAAKGEMDTARYQGFHPSTVMELIDRIRILQTKLDSSNMIQDAYRYQWLRERMTPADIDIIKHRPHGFPEMDDDVDTYIDSLRSMENETHPI